MAALAAISEGRRAWEEAALAWLPPRPSSTAPTPAPWPAARRALCATARGTPRRRGAALTALRRAIALPADQAAQVRAALEPLDAEVRRALGPGR
ncbi:MAG: hypothetical protein KF878_07310 [Planctomycetes bacterium]|nr:hypothetical protein [Planctomycetota bacterium]